jgi:hypothetical protein
MKKAEQLEISPPDKVVVIRDGSFRIKPILGVDIANIDDIHVIYDKSKTEISKNAKTYCYKDMADKKLMAQILQLEAQLWHDGATVGRIDNDSERKLEAIGLRIAIAQKAKELAKMYTSLYELDEHKEKITNLIYEEYVIFNYGMATTALKSLLKSAELDNKPEEKEKIGQWILYTHGNLLSASIVHKDHRWIERAKREGKEIDELLISKGLGHFVDTLEKKSEEEIKHDAYLPRFTGAVKSAISSLLNGFSSQQEIKPISERINSSPNIKKGPHAE